MKRRNFIKGIPGATAATVIGGHTLFAENQNNPLVQALLEMTFDTDRVLVIIQQNGGNDGLNMILPIDQYDALKAARTNILMPSASILKLTDRTGIHPAMEAMHNLYQEGKMGVVQSVGYPGFNYSHFRATDIWLSGSDANEFLDSGWAGRYLNYEYPNYPVGFPDSTMPDPLAIRVGEGIGLGLQMNGVNMAISINSASDPVDLTGNIFKDPANKLYSGKELSYVREVQRQTDKFGDVIVNAYNKATNKSARYPTTNNASTVGNLTNQLKIVARLIAGGLKTRIYWVSIGGFDTHANQVDASDLKTGVHANLLRSLSDNIAAFMDDCKLLGLEDRVTGFTFSEFGRRIKSNASLGTDHGSAIPILYFGKKIVPQVIGKNPDIPTTASTSSNLPMLYDFRSVYGTFLSQWFCVPQADVNRLLQDSFQNLPMIASSACLSTTAHEENLLAGKTVIKAYPNPFVDRTRIEYESLGGMLRIQVLNNLGSVVRQVVNKEMPKGSYNQDLELGGEASGIYYIRWENGSQSQIKTILKVQ
jgi:uncharacterized protein (DUF1501 family)